LRQDIIKLPVNVQHDPNYPSLSINDGNHLTNYISGYEAIRNGGEGGSGFIRIPDKITSSESNTLKFRALLFSTEDTGFYTHYVTNKIEFKNIQCLAKREITVGTDIYGAVNGRKTGLGYVFFGNQLYWGGVYESILGLQNYEHTYFSQFTRPSKGWGTGTSTNSPHADYPLVMELSEFRNNPSFWQPAVRRQLFTAEELSTQNIKADLLRTVWCGGYIDGDGRERIFEMVGEGDNTNTAQILYKDIISGTFGKIGGISKDDIFCEVSIKYNYDIGSDSYLGEISVTGIDTDTPRITGNNSLSDSQCNDIIDRCRNLYDRHKIINEAPKTLTENKWLFEDSDACTYLIKWLEWQGASDILGDRLEISFTLPLRLAMKEQIDIGRNIEIEIPHARGGTFSGLITSVSWQFDKGREEVRCKAYIKIPVEGGYDE